MARDLLALTSDGDGSNPSELSKVIHMQQVQLRPMSGLVRFLKATAIVLGILTGTARASDESAGESDESAEANSGDSADSVAPPEGAASSEPLMKLSRGTLTGQWFWAQDKVVPGIELGLGISIVEIDVEASFVWSSKSSPELDGTLIGNQLGLYLMFSPLQERYYDVSLGLGGDGYFLWGIHTGVIEGAFAPRAMVRFWPLENLGVSLSARGYLVQSEGLELGTTREGSSGSPVLLTTGLTWRFQ